MSLKNDFRVNDLYCIAFSPKKHETISTQLYTATYNMWLEVWKNSYKFFGWDPSKVYSDQWCRQDLILGLYKNDKPIGAAFFDEKNLRLPLFYNDSFFRMWPKELLDKISRWPNSEKALICTLFTIAPEYRKKNSEFDYKGLLHGLCLKQFVKMGNPFMIGTTVKSSMSEISKVHAAHLLLENVDENGLIVDLLYWKREDMLNFSFPQINLSVNTVWENQSRDNIVNLQKDVG